MIHETKPTRDQRAVADACVADYVAALARLEADPLLDDFGRAQPFHAIWQRVQGVGLERDESLQRIVYEALVWDLHAKTPEPGERHGQRWSSIPWSENGHNTLDPAASVARPGFYTHLAERVLATPSPMHRARYADVLWELDGGFQRAHAAATAYLAALPLLASTESERRHDAIVRALQLGLQIQEAEIVATARQALLGELTPPVVATAADDALALLPWLLQLPDRFVTNAELAQGRQYAEGAATILSADGEAGLFRARFAFELAAQFARRLRDAAGEQRLLLALGEAIEAQAAAAARRSRLDEGELLRKAFAHYASLGFAEQATTVKLRLEAAQGASEPEFNTFRQTIELDTEALDRLATALAGLPPPQSLAFIATRPGWYPEKAALAARADALRRQVPLLGAMGRRRFSMDGRLVDEATSDADLQQAQIFDLYNLWARGWGVGLARLYRRLADADRWTADTLTDFLASGIAFDADKLPWLRTGFERYFARDYMSCLCVLVPQVEDILRRLRGRLGLSTVSVRTGSGFTMRLALEEVLATPQLAAGLGADAIAWLRFLLIEQQGLNLRNEIAHGLLPEGWAREPLAALVVDALLHLQPLSLSPTIEAVQRQSSAEAAVLTLGIDMQAEGEPPPSTGLAGADLPDAAWIREMTDQIVHDFHPLRVILFGSHARGEAGPDSDVDLLVVLSAVDDRRQAAIEVGKSLAGIRVPNDIIVTDPQDIAERGDEPSTVLYHALRDGRVLYERVAFGEHGLTYGLG